jgi:hypothetical protein
MTVPPLPFGGVGCPRAVLVNDTVGVGVSLCVKPGLGDRLGVAAWLTVLDGVTVGVFETVGVELNLGNGVKLFVPVNEGLLVSEAVTVWLAVTLGETVGLEVNVADVVKVGLGVKLLETVGLGVNVADVVKVGLVVKLVETVELEVDVAKTVDVAVPVKLPVALRPGVGVRVEELAGDGVGLFSTGQVNSTTSTLKVKLPLFKGTQLMPVSSVVSSLYTGPQPGKTKDDQGIVTKDQPRGGVKMYP